MSFLSRRPVAPVSALSRRVVLIGAVAVGGSIWLGAPVAKAQDGITLPRPGSDLRRTLMDAMRPSFEDELGASVEFFVHRLAVWGGYAYAAVRPQRPGGRPIDWRRTKYAEAFASGAFEADMSLALLRRSRGRWEVVDFVIGPTDAHWISWQTEYGIPEAVFEMP
jgi:hypothetical protein